MIEETNAIHIATIIFESTKWEASEEDIRLLANNLITLERRELFKLNKRLFDGGNNIFDTFAEHNFAYELVEFNPLGTSILYEPNEVDGRVLKRPIDFVVLKGGITFWIQMKRLSSTKRDNRRSKDVEKIKRLAKEIQVNKFFWCSLSDDFNSSDVKPLVNFISHIAGDSIDDKKYKYPSPSQTKAEVTFWKPNKAVLRNLTLGGSGGLKFVDVTGESRVQIRGSLTNAAGAFDWDTDMNNINLVAIEIGNASHDIIDLGEAVFGDELHSFGTNGKQAWCRDDNGFLNLDKVSSKVAGIIAVKRLENLPVSRYKKLLLLNEKFKDRLAQIQTVMEFDKVIFFNELLHD